MIRIGEGINIMVRATKRIHGPGGNGQGPGRSGGHWDEGRGEEKGFDRRRDRLWAALRAHSLALSPAGV